MTSPFKGILWALFGFSIATQAARVPQPAHDNSYYDGVPPPACILTPNPPDFVFEGRSYARTPDLNPDLIQIDRLADRRECWAQALTELDAYETGHPNDPGVEYVAARLLWNDTAGIASPAFQDEVFSLIEDILRARPGFPSAEVLKAVVMTQALLPMDWERMSPNEKTRLARIEQLLSAAQETAPTHSGVLVDQRVLAFQHTPRGPALQALLAIVDAPGFEPEGRQKAVFHIGRTVEVPLAVREHVYRVWQTFPSSAPPDFKAMALARVLLLRGDRAGILEARRLLRLPEPLVAPVVVPSWCCDRLQWRELAALSYFQEAYLADPTAGPASRPLVEKANTVMGGSSSALTLAITQDPEWKRVWPFLQSSRPPRPPSESARDENGQTALCNAAALRPSSFQQDALSAALAAGEAVDAVCPTEGWGDLTALAIVFTHGPTGKDAPAVQLLLDHGANPNPKMGQGTVRDRCAAQPLCSKELLPLLDAAAAKK